MSLRTVQGVKFLNPSLLLDDLFEEDDFGGVAWTMHWFPVYKPKDMFFHKNKNGMYRFTWLYIYLFATVVYPFLNFWGLPKLIYIILYFFHWLYCCITVLFFRYIRVATQP